MYELTVLVEPSSTAKVSQLEIFGPAVCLYEFSELDEVIIRANSLPFVFQASVFAQDIDAGLYAARMLDASAVMVNDHTAFRTDWMSFGGLRQSEIGIGGIPSRCVR